MASSALLNIRLMAKNLTKPAFTAVSRSLTMIKVQTIRAARSMKRMMSGAKGQVVALLAVLGGFQALVRGPAEFNREMAKVGTLGEEARNSLAGFTAEVQRLSIESGIAPEALSEGLFNVISAGIKSSEAIGTLNTATRLAVAGSSDLTAAVSGLVVVANSFGVTGSQGMDALAQSLFAAQVQGKTTLEEIASNVGKVGASFKAASVDVDQMLVALSLITRTAGSTEEATTELAGTMKAFTKPTEAMQRVLKSLKIEFSESMLEGRNYGQTIADIRTEALRMGVPFAQVFADQRGYRGALKLSADEGRIFNDMIVEQKTLLGELDKSYTLMHGTLAVTLDRFGSLSKVLAMDFAEGAFDGLGDQLEDLIERSEELSIRAQIAGIQFRQSFLNVLPVLQSLTGGFKFMLASFLLTIEGIRFAFDALSRGVQDWIDKFSNIPGVGWFIDDQIGDAIEASNARLDLLRDDRQKTSDDLKAINQSISEHGLLNQNVDEKVTRARQTGADRDDPGLVGRLESQRPKDNLDELKAEFRRLSILMDGFRKERHQIEIERKTLMRDSGALKLFEGDTDTPLMRGQTSQEMLRDLDASMDFQGRSQRIAQLVQDVQAASIGMTEIDWTGDGLEDASRALDKLEKELAALGTKAPEALAGVPEALEGVADAASGIAPGIDLGTAATARWYDSLVKFWEDSKVGWAGFKAGLKEAVKTVKTLTETFSELGQRVVRIAEDSLARFFDDMAAGTEKGSEAFKSFIRSVLSEINRMMAQKVVQKFVNLLLSSAWSGGGGGGGGGSGTIDFGDGSGPHELAHGGIVTSPTLAMIGEAGQNEAVVPLPNGRSIPVDFRGAGKSSGDTFNINISAVDGASVERMLSSASGRRAIEGAVRNARATRRDMR